MRRIVVFNRVSADGYFAKLDGDLSWFVADDGIDRAGADNMPRFDAMLFGRRTYDLFEHFWPNALNDPETAADPHDARRHTKTIRDMAVWINETHKLVFSNTRKELAWQNSRSLGAFDANTVRELKLQSGKDIIVFGSGSIVSQLSEQGLIDEYQFIVSPLLLGDGKPMVSGLANSVELTLIEAKPYPSGNVSLRYARKTRA